jgi:predicted nucleic acid-binding protein
MQGNCVFIDSNIMIYAYSDTERTKQQISRQLIKENRTVISTQVLQEIANTLSRKFKIDYRTIEQILQECVSDNDLLYLNRQDTILKACSIALQYQFSFYDSLIIASALETNCSILYSEDLQHKQVIDHTLTIINPYR